MYAQSRARIRVALRVGVLLVPVTQATVFVLLYQESKRVKRAAVAVERIRVALRVELLISVSLITLCAAVRYVSICTFVPVKQVT